VIKQGPSRPVCVFGDLHPGPGTLLLPNHPPDEPAGQRVVAPIKSLALVRTPHCVVKVRIVLLSMHGADARPEGKWISTVRLGPKSQIVIPKEVRDMFGLGPGDSLLLMADVERGIALVDPAEYADVMSKVLGSPSGEEGHS